jgi:hypothetical protein
MPWKTTLQRAAKDKQEGKAPTTQAGEFVKEEMEHIRRGKHGARSAKQAIAIGLSKARRAGVDLAPPEEGATSKATRKSAKRDVAAGKKTTRRSSATGTPAKRPSAKRSRAAEGALKREGHAAASKKALSQQAKSAARKRSPAERSAAARKASKTKGAAARSDAARKAAKTRARNKRG